MHFVEQKYKLNEDEKESKMERQTLCFSTYKEVIFCISYFFRSKFFYYFCFISMYGVLNTLLEYIYVFISKNTTSYTFLLVFKTAGSIQRILNSLVMVTNEGLIA